MTAFTDLLRKERKLVCSGFELLDSYRRDLENGDAISIPDLRMAVYGIQGMLEATLLLKEERLLYAELERRVLPDEIRSLIPLRRLANRKVHEDLLSLRFGVENTELPKPTVSALLGKIARVVALLQSFVFDSSDLLLDYADIHIEATKQSELLLSAKRLDQADQSSQLARSRQIVNMLRMARGFPAA